MADDTDMAGPAAPDRAAESGGASDVADVADAATDADEVARLAADVPAATTRRKRKARLVVGKRARKIRKPRCPSCGYFFDAIESWTCPRCAADLREVGFTQPRTVKQKVGAFFGALWRRLRRRPRSGTGCGKCEYPARGIGGFDCPECGCDLRKVGIIDRDRIHTGGAIALCALLTTCVVLVGYFTLRGWTINWMIPQQASRSEVVRLVDTLHRFDVDLSSRGAGTRWRWARPVPLQTMNITIRSHGKRAGPWPVAGLGNRFAVIRRQVDADTYSNVHGVTDDLRGRGDRPGDNGSLFTGAVLVHAMRQAGLEVNDPAIESRAAMVMEAVARLEAGDFEKDMLAGTFTVTYRKTESMSPSLDHRVLNDLFWLAAWAGTTVLVSAVIWRRLRHRPDSVLPAPTH